MKKNQLILTLILILSLVSCATQKFHNGDVGITENTVPDFEDRIHFFFYGVFQERDIDVKKICKDKPVRLIVSYYQFWEIFTGSMLHGIWRPSSYKVYCEK